MRLVFIAGTGTEVGKTHVAARLARRDLDSGKRVGVYKPVASGCVTGAKPDELVSIDAECLWSAAGQPRSLEQVCPQRFFAPLAPNEAAKAEGKTVNRDQLVDGLRPWRDGFDLVYVEGAGGLFSPLAEGWLNLDFYLELPDAELRIVAANTLGVIHQVVASCRAAQAAGATVTTLYLNTLSPEPDASTKTNVDQIRTFCPGIRIELIPYSDDDQRSC